MDVNRRAIGSAGGIDTTKSTANPSAGASCFMESAKNKAQNPMKMAHNLTHTWTNRRRFTEQSHSRRHGIWICGVQWKFKCSPWTAIIGKADFWKSLEFSTQSRATPEENFWEICFVQSILCYADSFSISTPYPIMESYIIAYVKILQHNIECMTPYKSGVFSKSTRRLYKKFCNFLNNQLSLHTPLFANTRHYCAICNF